MPSSASKRRRRMERNGEPRKRNELIALPVLQEDKFMQLEEWSEECLLPGIGNEVTLELIATKLPWKTLHSLSSVGPAWRQAMQNRLVYDARVRAHSGESFVIISDTQFKACRLKATAISLYSLTNNTCYQLPPIPQVESGFPYDCDCIALDRTVYVLRGLKDRTHKFQQLRSKDVYVLDMAGQWQWKPCARMQEARAYFRCAAKDGKIYVFRGTSGKSLVLGSDVYDPSLDAWSAITTVGSVPSKKKPNVDRSSGIRHRDCFRTDNLNSTASYIS